MEANPIGYIAFNKTPMKIQREAPEFGQHTEDILTEILGYSWEEVEKVRGAGVI